MSLLPLGWMLNTEVTSIANVISKILSRSLANWHAFIELKIACFMFDKQ